MHDYDQDIESFARKLDPFKTGDTLYVTLSILQHTRRVLRTLSVNLEEPGGLRTRKAGDMEMLQNEKSF